MLVLAERVKMNRFARLFLVPLAFALAMGIASPADAGEAQNFVQARQGELVSALKAPASEARNRKVGAIIDGMIDYDKLAGDSLGRHKADRSEAELKEFTEILRKLVRRNYERNIQKTLDYDVTYTGETGGEDATVVSTSAKSKKGNNDTVTVDYKLRKKDGQWWIYDIVTERSSLVSNYRNQFNKVITKEGWDALIKKLKDQLAKK